MDYVRPATFQLGFKVLDPTKNSLSSLLGNGVVVSIDSTSVVIITVYHNLFEKCDESTKRGFLQPLTQDGATFGTPLAFRILDSCELEHWIILAINNMKSPLKGLKLKATSLNDLNSIESPIQEMFVSGRVTDKSYIMGRLQRDTIAEKDTIRTVGNCAISPPPVRCVPTVGFYHEGKGKLNYVSSTSKLMGLSGSAMRIKQGSGNEVVIGMFNSGDSIRTQNFTVQQYHIRISGSFVQFTERALKSIGNLRD